MKKCPQCEFVYEDEQSLCDMDGSKLIFDSRQLPKLQALNNAAAKSGRAKAFWRSRLIPASAGLVLAIVLGSVYYASTHRPMRTQVIPAAQRQPIAQPIQVTDEPAQPNANLKTNEPAKPELAAPAKPADKTDAKSDPKSSSERPPETKTKRPANLNSPQPQPIKPASIEEKPKKETKFSAILKKTGRILKKPFKL